MGIHYHVGFENTIYIDEYEGIRPDFRGSFKWIGSSLYYRYAKSGEFGIATVNTSGTTATLISETDLGFQNHLNFAFDVTSSQGVYFAYCTGDAGSSTLTIKRRTSGGTESTILTDTQDLADLTTLDDAGGAYLGAHECLFHDDALYFLAPIGRVDSDEDDDATTRSREKAAGMVLFSCDVTVASPTLTVIDKWDFVSHSAANLTIHNNSVHYIEQPIAATKFKPVNPDL